MNYCVILFLLLGQLSLKVISEEELHRFGTDCLIAVGTWSVSVGKTFLFFLPIFQLFHFATDVILSLSLSSSYSSIILVSYPSR